MNNGGSYDIRQDPYYYSQNRAEEHQFMNRQNQQYYSQRNDRTHFHRAEPRFQVTKKLSRSCKLLFSTLSPLGRHLISKEFVHHPYLVTRNLPLNLGKGLNCRLFEVLNSAALPRCRLFDKVAP